MRPRILQSPLRLQLQFLSQFRLQLQLLSQFPLQLRAERVLQHLLFLMLLPARRAAGELTFPLGRFLYSVGALCKMLWGTGVAKGCQKKGKRGLRWLANGGGCPAAGSGWAMAGRWQADGMASGRRPA